MLGVQTIRAGKSETPQRNPQRARTLCPILPARREFDDVSSASLFGFLSVAAKPVSCRNVRSGSLETELARKFEQGK